MYYVTETTTVRLKKLKLPLPIALIGKTIHNLGLPFISVTTRLKEKTIDATDTLENCKNIPV